jgi:hypothetical protein
MSVNKIKIFDILLILAVVILSAAVFILVTNLQLLSRPEKQSNTLIPRNDAVPTEITKEVALWKEYTARGSVFTYKYPPEWQLKEVRPGQTVLYSPDLLEPPKGAPISVYQITNKSYEETVAANRKVMQDVTEKPLTVNTYTGIEMSGIYNSSVLGRLKMYLAILNDGEKIVVVEYTDYQNTEGFMQVYKDIVQSIRLQSSN